MDVVLISTYELGRQPFGVASPAAWLRERGARVTCLDLSREPFREEPVRAAELVAFYVPMHTATRLAIELIAPVRRISPRAHLCFYGLYAPMNEPYLRRLGVATILGGEFEEGLVSLVERLGRRRLLQDPALCHPESRFHRDEGSALESNAKKIADSSTPPVRRNDNQPFFPALQDRQAEPVISLARQSFRVPDRAGLVPLEKYARLVLPGGARRVVGYTEASRGCKHLCRHCPIVPVYNGIFRIVPREIVLEDVRRQVAAAAEHITFGDPDFFNGIGHALAVVEALHREFPQLTYDVTIKIEHLLRYAHHIRTLHETGCLFVTSAVESVDDTVLARLDKGHTRADFLAVAELFREVGLALHPTFVPFTPWTTLESYGELLRVIAENGLIENVAPIQLAIRLLIPAGLLLLELDDVRALVGVFDEAALVHPWQHSDARVDALCDELQQIVHSGEKLNRPRARIFARIWEAASAALDAASLEEHALAVRRGAARCAPPLPQAALLSRAAIPYLNEPWYC